MATTSTKRKPPAKMKAAKSPSAKASARRKAPARKR